MGILLSFDRLPKKIDFKNEASITACFGISKNCMRVPGDIVDIKEKEPTFWPLLKKGNDLKPYSQFLEELPHHS